MQMADEYVMYLSMADSEFPQLHLCTLSSINQKKPLIRVKQWAAGNLLDVGRAELLPSIVTLNDTGSGLLSGLDHFFTFLNSIGNV